MSNSLDRHEQCSVTVTTLSGATAVLTLVGEVDIATVGRMKEALDGAAGDHDRVVVDLTRVNFISCAGLAALRAAHQHTELIVVADTRIVRRAIEVTGLDEVLTVRTEKPSTLHQG